MDDVTATVMGLNLLSPELRAAMTNTFPHTTLRDARQRLENAATPAEQKALKPWVFQYELRENAAREHQFSQSLMRDTDHATGLALRLREEANRLAEIRADCERGAATSPELRQAALDADREVQEARAIADSMDANYVQREALRAADLADLQDQMLNRMPVLRDRLPTLLSDWPESQHKMPSAGQRRANTNPAGSLRTHADALYGAVKDAIRALEEAERREKAMQGPKQNDLTERFEALRSRVA